MTRRALIVDDNRPLAEDLAEILASEGYQVQVFDDPMRALLAADELTFHVALLDIRMPGLDGVSLHRRLLARHPHACFVLMTAYTEDDRIAQALAAGVRAVLSKPVALRDLLDAIDHASHVERGQLLLVEDDPSFGPALAEALEESGYEVRLARSLAEAQRMHGLELATIVDTCLPDGNGALFARELSQANDKPVVLMSGYDPDEPRRAVHEIGARARFLTKPFSPDALLVALRELRAHQR